jgi:HK97 family phage portal protein
VNFFNRMFGRKAAELTYDQVARAIDGGSSLSMIGGMAVTPKTALEVATVLACARIIADGCATPNLAVFRQKKDGTRERADNIPEARLLERRPNEWQTSLEWRRMMTLHAVLTGAGLSIMIRGDNNRVRELLPVEPGSWQVREIGRYQYVYDCWDKWGKIGTFRPDEVFVLRNLQWELIEPMNAVKVARNSIGLAMATDRGLAAQQNNGLRASGVYSVEGSLNMEQHKRLTDWLAGQAGAANKGRPLILDRNAKWTPTAQTNSDGQASELRAQTIEDVCRVFNVFPIMVGHSDKAATFASSEAFFSAHLKHTLIPWQKNWNQNFDEMLLDGAGPLYTEFDNRYLTAGAMKDQALWVTAVVGTGTMTRNEVRDDLGLDPLAGLDEPLTPMNMNTGGADASKTPSP